MRSARLETYVSRLAHELKTRGLEDARIVEEAREHLVDAVEDGRRRGLSLDAAEHEAFERFGAPEAIAAYVVRERARNMNRLAVLLGTVWLRKWWILVPTALTAFVTSAASYYFLPTRYQPAAASGHGAARVAQINERLLISSLEKVIADSGLSNGDINVDILAWDPRGGMIRAEGTVRVGSKK